MEKWDNIRFHFRSDFDKYQKNHACSFLFLACKSLRKKTHILLIISIEIHAIVGVISENIAGGAYAARGLITITGTPVFCCWIPSTYYLVKSITHWSATKPLPLFCNRPEWITVSLTVSLGCVVKDLPEIRCICSIWKYFNENCSFEKSFNYLERLRGETHKAWRGTMEDICKAQICLRNAHTDGCYCPWLFLSIPWWDPCRWLSWW